MGNVELNRVCRRFSSASATYDRHAKAQRHVCERLLSLLRQEHPLHFGRVLELGCGSGGFTRLLMSEGQVSEWSLNDLCESWLPELSRLMSGSSWEWLPGNAEEMEFRGRYDLIVSANALQWMDDLPGFMGRLSSCMASDGILLFNLFAPDNLSEIRSLTGLGLEYPNVEEVRQMLEENYRVLRLEQEHIVLHFPEPLSVLRHLKYTGVTATATGMWTKGRQMQFCKDYTERYSTEDGQVCLTYSPIYIVAIKNKSHE